MPRLSLYDHIHQFILGEKTLLAPIPSYSTHCEPLWAAPGVDWEKLAKAYASSPIVRDQELRRLK